jgi:hypothetical protein
LLANQPSTKQGLDRSIDRSKCLAPLGIACCSVVILNSKTHSQQLQPIRAFAQRLRFAFPDRTTNILRFPPPLLCPHSPHTTPTNQLDPRPRNHTATHTAAASKDRGQPSAFGTSCAFEVRRIVLLLVAWLVAPISPLMTIRMTMVTRIITCACLSLSLSTNSSKPHKRTSKQQHEVSPR